jgi:hypothetical protein
MSIFLFFFLFFWYWGLNSASNLVGRHSTTLASFQPYFALVILGSCIFAWGQPQIRILLCKASYVARITEMNHHVQLVFKMEHQQLFVPGLASNHDPLNIHLPEFFNIKNYW